MNKPLSSVPIIEIPRRRFFRRTDSWPSVFLQIFLCFTALWVLTSLKGWGAFDGYLVPELKVSFHSALGPGYVMDIVNAGNKPLFNVRVSSSRWDKYYKVSSQLDSGSSTGAGWIELPEAIKPGHTYKIRVDGYLLARTARMPER